MGIFQLFLELAPRQPEQGFAFVQTLVKHPVDCRSQGGVDLQLSGHTHGGQFIPFPLLARAIWRRYTGLYELKGTYLYCTTGGGTWGPPFRLGTMCEIAVLDIRGRAKDAPAGKDAPAA